MLDIKANEMPLRATYLRSAISIITIFIHFQLSVQLVNIGKKFLVSLKGKLFFVFILKNVSPAVSRKEKLVSRTVL